MAETLAFAADGRVTAHIELQPLSEINTIFEHLKAGDVPARFVLEFSALSAVSAVESVVNELRVPSLSKRTVSGRQ